MTRLLLSSVEGAKLRAHREHQVDWRKWGPYLSERAWGTVREDYSDTGDAWHYFPHDHARFYEYFHGDNGAGLGASHQTGWTALVAKLIQQFR